MACRRCSTCGINYPEFKTEPCIPCGGTLSFFSDIEPHSAEEIVDRIRKIVWAPKGSFVLYGGVTLMDRFLKTIESLRGADDFIVECGDGPLPEGNE